MQFAFMVARGVKCSRKTTVTVSAPQPTSGGGGAARRGGAPIFPGVQFFRKREKKEDPVKVVIEAIKAANEQTADPIPLDADCPDTQPSRPGALDHDV